MFRRHNFVPFLLGAAMASPGAVSAQDVTTDANWEVEVHVGAVTPASGLGGQSLRQVPASDVFAAVGSPSARSLPVSSWFFGDGTALFNRVNQLTGVNAAIVSLDGVLQAGVTRRRGGPNVGFTVARWVRPRLALELHADYSPTAVVLTPQTLGAIEASSVSFVDAWDRYLQSGVAASGAASDVFVSADTENGGGHQLFVTAEVKAIVRARRRSRMYVGGGMGIVRSWNRTPGATLSGGYQFAGVAPSGGRFLLAPFAERDEVRIRVEAGRSRTPVGSIRGGVEYYMDSWRGFRLDMAFLVSPGAVSTAIDATPAVAVRDAGAAISGTTNPTIQFSSHPSDVIPSSLSGPSLHNFATFRGHGLQVQLRIAAGYFVRF